MEEVKDVKESVFVFDGVEYKYNEASDNAKSAIRHIQEIDSKLDKIVFDMDELKIARIGFLSILKAELVKE